MRTEYICILFLLSVLLCLQACSSGGDLGIIRTDSNDVIFGFNEAKYIIGKTKMSEIENLKELEQEGAKLTFNTDETLRSVEINSRNFKTTSGVKVGDIKKAIRAAYGNPDQEDTELKKGEVVIGTIEGLFYDKAAFLTRNDSLKAMLLSDPSLKN